MGLSPALLTYISYSPLFLSILTASPGHGSLQLIQLVLTYATQETDNPDLRDRAYIYWRLLSTDPGGL